MKVKLFYLLKGHVYKFTNDVKILEYFVSSKKSDIKIFLKGYELCLTKEEEDKLSNEDFAICLEDETILYNKSEISLVNNKIVF